MPVAADHDEASKPSQSYIKTRVQQKEERILTRLEARAMANDAELLDHLVIQGSYHRHHERRLQQQIDRYDAETMPRRERAGAKRLADQMNHDDPGIVPRQQRLPPKPPDRSFHVEMGHAGDAQAYMKKKAVFDAPVCDAWPRQYHMATNLLPDLDWDQLHGDGLAQRAIYRAGGETGAESASPSLPSWEDEEDRTGMRMHIGENPFPDLIYKAWERAMHAASTVVTVPASSSKQPETVEEADEEPLYSRVRAEAECEKMNFELDETVYSTVAVSRCPSCEVKECSSIEELKNHYYGTDASKGCCWELIARHREKFVLQALERDAKNQIDQMLHLAFNAVIDLVQVQGQQLDCFDLHNSLEDTWTHAVRTEEPDCRAPHLETLQVAEGEPPLVLNQAILDSLHRRITERYSRVPR